MIRLAQVREGRDLVSILNVAVNMIQNIMSSRGARNMLMKFRKNSFKIGLIKVPCYYKNAIRVSSLHIVDSRQQNIHACLVLALGGMYTAIQITTVNSHGK